MQHTVWTGHISFGLTCIPIKLCAAARDKRIEFHTVYGIDGSAGAQAASANASPPNVLRFPSSNPADLPMPEHVARVRRAFVGEDGIPLPSSALFKAFEPTPGRFAVFRPDDLEPLRAPKSSSIRIAMFVVAKEVNPKYLELSYDVWPDRDGEELYELFYDGLADNGFYAVGEVPLFGRERWVAIRPGFYGLVLHTLYYRDEVRPEDEYHIEFGRASAKGRALSGELMRAYQGNFADVPLNNKHDEQVLDFVLTRCEEQFATGPDKTPQGRRAIDISELLSKSLELKRKPPQSQRPGAAPRKRKNRRGGRS